MTTTSAVDYYRKESKRFLDQVDVELDKGELEQAAQSLWNAAAHGVKAAAERRGWEHDTAHDLADTIPVSSMKKAALST